MISGIKTWFVLNEFRSKRLCSKRNLNTCYPIGNNPFQGNTLLYPEIRSKRARYIEI